MRRSKSTSYPGFFPLRERKDLLSLRGKTLGARLPQSMFCNYVARPRTQLTMACRVMATSGLEKLWFASQQIIINNKLQFTCNYSYKAPYKFLRSRKHTFQIQNLVHWYFVRRMKLTVWYITASWESETATKKCVTVVAMATITFQNGC